MRRRCGRPRQKLSRSGLISGEAERVNRYVEVRIGGADDANGEEREEIARSVFGLELREGRERFKVWM